MNQNCIVSFANSRGNYVNAINRLHESLRINFSGDFLGFIGENSIGSPMHSQVPYAFKLYAIKKAIESGYKKVIYLDSSCFAIKNVDVLFERELEDLPMLFQMAGHKVGTWTNDFTLDYFNVTRDEAMDMPMIGNAGMLGLNFTRDEAKYFFQHWGNSMDIGCFAGSWNNNEKTESQDERCLGHRHDMSCSSIILNQMELISLAKNGDEYLQYAGVYDETLNDTIFFKAQGM